MSGRVSIRDAAVAFSDLNTFATVVTILEGGHLHSKSYKAADRIIKICHAETRKRLIEYDEAVAHLGTNDVPQKGTT